MKLIERYIFAKLVRAFFLSLVALTATVWLTQALRQFDLVSAMGQTLITFFQVTLLLLPPLATVVAPVAVMIAVIYTFNGLNDGSELAVINATGHPAMVAAQAGADARRRRDDLHGQHDALHVAAVALRLWREMITNVKGIS